MRLSWNIVDTHCHIEQDEFSEDREEVIMRAINAGIAMITSAIHSETWEIALDLSSSYDGVFSSIGLDPTNFKAHKEAVDFIRSHENEIIAIGEVGMDHYIIRDHSERDQQEAVFRSFISLAVELKKPIQVHSRSAGKKTLDVLEESDATRVHMHAFDGRASYARRASKELGYYFSIPTSIVRSRQKQKLVKAIDIEHLLLETDSPVLGPGKGERNEPNNIGLALDEVAEILRRDRDELQDIILENTLRLYPSIS